MWGRTPPGSHSVALHPLCGEHPATPPIVVTLEPKAIGSIPDCYADGGQHQILLTRIAFYKYVCFEGHFARKQNHFIPLFA